MKKPFVFISYSTKDTDSANLVHSYLEGNGINCWIASRNIEGGESFAVQIVDAIEDCAVFVMITSENSNDSDHVSNELSLAFSGKKKIIPFRLQDVQLSKSNTYFLQQAQWIDAYQNMNEALKHLLIAVRTVIPAEEKAKPIEVEIPNAFKNTDKAEEKDDSIITMDDYVNEQILEELKAVDLNTLSPYEAITLLFDLQKRLK